jgi:hypothetical protein
MKLAITAIVSLIAGGLIGGFLGFDAGMGIGATGGLVAGSQGGICLSLESAKEKGLVSAGQIDAVIGATIAKIKAQAQIPEEQQPKWIAGEADCTMIIAELRRAAAEQGQ